MFIFSDLGRARSSSTTRRSACVVAPTFGRHVLLSTSSGHFNFLRFFLDIDLYFFSSTPVVSGGASVDSDRPLPGDTTRCLYFTGTGGVLHREHPPFYWCLCFVLFSPTTNRQPSPQTTEFVHNSSEAGRFFPRFFFCGERTVLRRFLRFSRALSLESSLSAHSCRLITRKSTTSRLGRSFDHPIYSRVTEPRSFPPSASRSYLSYSFVAFDELSGLTRTRSGEPHHHICTRKLSRVHPSDGKIGGLGPHSRICRGRKP